VTFSVSHRRSLTTSSLGLTKDEPKPEAMGQSIKYVKLEGEGVRERVVVYDRGKEGQRAYDVTL